MNAPASPFAKWMRVNRVRELRWAEFQQEFRVELMNGVGGWGDSPEQAFECAKANQDRWSKAA